MYIRSLTLHEQQTIELALQSLVEDKYPKDYARAAQSMLDQKMHQDFLWKTKD